jgi:hypothetical protein
MVYEGVESIILGKNRHQWQAPMFVFPNLPTRATSSVDLFVHITKLVI